MPVFFWRRRTAAGDTKSPADTVPTEDTDVANDEPTLLYYDADGNRVAEGSETAVRQYLSDDPARPDAPGRSNVVTSTAEPETDEVIEATKEPAPDQKAESAPKNTKARNSSDNK
jgi:hypothetical protein